MKGFILILVRITSKSRSYRIRFSVTLNLSQYQKVSYTPKIILALVNQRKTTCSLMTGNIFHGIYLSPQRVITIYMGKQEISVG